MSTKIFFAGVILLGLFSTACVRHEVLPESDGFTGWIAGEAYDGYGTILKSGDNGLSWFRQGSVSQIPGINMNDVSAFDLTHIWSVGDNQNGYGMILYSSNGGVSWERQGTKDLLGSGSLLAVHAKTGKRVWVSGEKGKLFYSDNQGSTWNPVILDSLSKPAFSGIAVAQNSIWVIGNIADSAGHDSANIVLHSMDGGSTFTASHFLNAAHLNAVSALNDTTVLIASGSSLYKSMDGGSQWYMIYNSTFGNVLSICAGSEDNIWAAGEQGRAFRSADGGSTWETFWPQTGKYALNGISLSGSNTVWICGSGGNPSRKGVVYYSGNAGKTWFIGILPVNAGVRGLSFMKGVR